LRSVRNLNLNKHSNNGNQWSTKLCDNITDAVAFINKTRQLINALETNGSYTEVLEEHAHAIAYIESSTTFALLSSNCTAYFAGLNAAGILDAEAAYQEQMYENNASRLFGKILQLFGIQGFPAILF
jgi:hypothetical protein